MNHLKSLGLRAPNYDKFPSIAVPPEHADSCWSGWESICSAILPRTASSKNVVAVDCYPGVHVEEALARLAAGLRPLLAIDTRQAFKSEAEVDTMVGPFLGGDDPVFGYLNTTLQMADFLDPLKSGELTRKIAADSAAGLVLVVGPGASLLAPGADLLVYADMPRWEGQLRQRRG